MLLSHSGQNGLSVNLGIYTNSTSGKWGASEHVRGTSKNVGNVGNVGERGEQMRRYLRGVYRSW